MTSANQTAHDGQTPETGAAPPSGLILLLPTLLPAAILLLALILPGHILQSDQSISNDIGLGPTAWPKAMLNGVALFSVLWIARDIWVLGAASRAPTLSIPVEESHYHFGKAIVGLMMIIAYGWLLPKLGFAVSTATFIAVWCLFGRLRNILVVAPIALIGTVALLWLFMGLALMPLPRGMGVFDTFSIWLLRATGIY
jgi:putative tricarboxylic transport membrane protein